MNDTIQKLKELGLFDDFKKAMETIVEELDKPEHKWDNDKLNLNGLYYWRTNRLRGKHFKLYFCRKHRYFDKMYNKGISFGLIDWSHRNILKGRNDFFSKEDYNEYMEKIENIDFSCFHGKTPKEILDMLYENISSKFFIRNDINSFIKTYPFTTKTKPSDK